MTQNIFKIMYGPSPTYWKVKDMGNAASYNPYVILICVKSDFPKKTGVQIEDTDERTLGELLTLPIYCTIDKFLD